MVTRLPTGPSFSPADLEQAIREFVIRLEPRPTALGIAIPGLVEGGDRVVACDVLPRLTGWRASAGLTDLGCATLLVNDVKAALAEATHDLPAGMTAGIVMAGTAVGAAFLVDGRPLLGTSGWAGELGYMPVLENGRVRRLDELAGGQFMAARLGVDSAGLADAAGRGDEAALGVVREGGQALGLSLATVVNLLNPARLAVGGGALSLPGYWDAAREAAEQYSLPDLWRDCTLYRVDDVVDIAARGAARCSAAEAS